MDLYDIGSVMGMSVVCMADGRHVLQHHFCNFLLCRYWRSVVFACVSGFNLFDRCDLCNYEASTESALYPLNCKATSRHMWKWPRMIFKHMEESKHYPWYWGISWLCVCVPKRVCMRERNPPQVCLCLCVFVIFLPWHTASAIGVHSLIKISVSSSQRVQGRQGSSELSCSE